MTEFQLAERGEITQREVGAKALSEYSAGIFYDPTVRGYDLLKHMLKAGKIPIISLYPAPFVQMSDEDVGTFDRCNSFNVIVTGYTDGEYRIWDPICDKDYSIPESKLYFMIMNGNSDLMIAV